MDRMKQDNEASFGEFMKISLEGFSWAENIYQRVENICTENNMVQNPGKYVNVVGEHFKKVIHTVVNDLCDHADDVLELFSELTLGHASLVKTSGNMAEELDGVHVHEDSSACICGEEAAFMENLSLEHDSVPNVLENLVSESKKSTSDGTVSTTNKLDEAFSSTVNSLSEHGGSTLIHESSRIQIEESAPLEKYACVRFEGEVHSVEDLSQVKLPSKPQFLNKKEVSTSMLVETPMSATEGLNCSTMNFSNATAFDVNLTRSLLLTEANSSMTHKRIATASPENLNIYSSEEFGNSSMFSLKNEDLNEFEDVKLEDDFEAVKAENDWDDIVKAEIALISSLVAKKESSKKTLKKMLTSRWRPSRGRQLETYQADLHSKTSLESDWELL